MAHPELRVLILTASMGSGHVQVSREVQQRLQDRGHDVVIADFNDLLPAGTGHWLARFYPWMVNHAPWLYDAIFRTFFKKQQHKGERASVPAALAGPALRRLVERHVADIVVSTYHIAGLAAARLRDAGKLRVPAVTFITTFGVHDLWLHPGTDAYLTISPQAAEAVRARSSAPVVVCGPVVRPGFGATGADAAAAVRRELAAPENDDLALIVAGSLGMGDVERALRVIAGAPGWTPVVVCGRNDELSERLRAVGAGVVLGWVEDMAALMGASTVLVDNAGGLSSKEALAIGLPVVTFRPIAGHGRDDAEAMERLGVTRVIDDDAELLRVIDEIAGSGVMRQRLAQRGRELFVGDAAADIERIALASGRGRRVAEGRPAPDSAIA